MDESIYKQAENALKISKEQLVKFMDSLPQMAWAGQANGRILYFNKAWNAYTGMPAGNTMGWIKTVHPEDSCYVIEAWKNAPLTGDYHVECRVLNGVNGSYKWFLEQAVPIRDEHGKATIWFGIYTDINDEKQGIEPL